MFKFVIYYKCKSTDATHCATVFAEDMASAVEKIKSVDEDFERTDDVFFTEKPNWLRAEE